MGDDLSIPDGPFNMGRSVIRIVGSTVFYRGCHAYDNPYDYYNNADSDLFYDLAAGMQSLVESLTAL